MTTYITVNTSAPQASKEVYYPLEARTTSAEPDFLNPKAALDIGAERSVLVDIHAVALNHRDLFIRQRLYPAISADAAICADGAGVVQSVSRGDGSGEDSDKSEWQGRRVVILPGHGWSLRRSGPEGTYVIIGGTSASPFHGTLGTRLRVPVSQVAVAPAHLTAAEAASLPLAGLTAWRAVVTKLADVEAEAAAEGRPLRVLITGIGGGVALFALQFAVARGQEVWVTSSSAEKIAGAVRLGARGGEDYRADGWAARLVKLAGGPFDAVVDSAGGPGFGHAIRTLRAGGVVVQYGMTAAPHSVQWDMTGVLRNVELRGSTMGSAREFGEMVRFVEERGIVPVIDEVADVSGAGEGAEEALARAIPRIDQLFEKMRAGNQFGKLVLQLRDPGLWKGRRGEKL